MSNTANLLDWSVILTDLNARCQTPYGQAYLKTERLHLSDETEITLELTRVSEGKRLLQRYSDPDLPLVPEISSLLQRLAKQGDVQSVAELADLLRALKGLRVLARFLMQHRSKEDTPALLPDIEAVQLPNDIIAHLNTLVTEEGFLQETASPVYSNLKQRIRETENRIQETLQEVLSQPKASRILQETMITEREGRAVLPVKIEHRSEIPGLVHGSSATGSTLFIEPQRVVPMNSQLIALQGELTQEIQRILKTVSGTLREHVTVLRLFVDQMAVFDVLLAKARQSLRWDANPVTIISNPGVFQLYRARHPILLQQAQQEVVPNDLTLLPPHRTLLITGPNTGGKTVLLKMIGLFAMMLEHGLHLPVREGSSMSRFHPILVDIGDPQDMTQSLSTFSGHLARIKTFLSQPDLSHGLILIDEICAGTDPQEGAALAQAILTAFYDAGATTLVTTHWGELKLLAYEHAGYQNAGVTFDLETLRPTYRLLLGVSGNSHAIEIAARLGLPSDIIAHATQGLAASVTDNADLMTELETHRHAAAAEHDQVKQLRQTLANETEHIQDERLRLERDKQKTLEQFREGLKAQMLPIERELKALKQTFQQAEDLPEQELEGIQRRLKHLHDQTGELFTKQSQTIYQDIQLAWKDLHVGDLVSSRSLNLRGTVIQKHEGKQEVTLESGILKTTVPLSDLIEVKTPSPKPKPSRKSPAPLPRVKGFQKDCDVRGMNSEDAIGVLEKFLDDALGAGLAEVGIIHGLGSGKLKKAIRVHLKSLPYVKGFHPSEAIEGGDGRTIIQL